MIGLLVLVFMLSACVKQERKASTVDWVLFLNVAAAELQSDKPEVHMTFKLNGEVEETVTCAVEWPQVFGTFLADSVTAFTMERSYERTELLTETDSFVHWELPKTGRKPFSIRLGYVRGTDSLVYVQLANKTDNLVYESFQEVAYRVEDSLLIRGYNKMRWGDPNSYEQLIQFQK